MKVIVKDVYGLANMMMPQLKEKQTFIYTLHGSLSWKRHRNGRIVDTGEERRATDTNYTDHLLVFPTLSPKEGQEVEPYKTIRKNFKVFVKTADVFIVIGFSFRDKHVKSIFSDFLKQGRTLIIVSPTADNNISENLLKKSLLQPSPVSWSQDRSIKLYKKNGTIITVNEKITSKNLEKIKQAISAALLDLSGNKTLEK